MSPPRLTSTPQPVARVAAAAARSAAQALAVAPRSSYARRECGPSEAASIEDDCPPTGACTRAVQRRGRLGGHLAGRDQMPVTVVPGQLQRPTDRRVDIAVGQLSGAQGHLECLDEKPTPLHRPAGAGVHARELGVRAKAAARAVDRSELRIRLLNARSRARGDRSTAARRLSRAPARSRTPTGGGSAMQPARQDPPETTGGGASWAGADSCAGADSWAEPIPGQGRIPGRVLHGGRIPESFRAPIRSSCSVPDSVAPAGWGTWSSIPRICLRDGGRRRSRRWSLEPSTFCPGTPGPPPPRALR